jgi:hypothetical protein
MQQISSGQYETSSEKPGEITVVLSGEAFIMTSQVARLLISSMNKTLHKAELICEDCGVQNSAVEASGCPVSNEPATLCDSCFNRRDVEY